MLPALWWRDSAWGSVWLLPDLLILLALLPLLRPTVLRVLLSLLLLLAVLSLYGDGLVGQVLSRPLNLWLDPWMLEAGFRFLAGSLGLATALLIAMLALLAAILLGMLLFSLLGRIRDLRAAPAAALALSGLSLLVLAELSGPAFDSTAIRPALWLLAEDQQARIQRTLAEHERLLERASSDALQARAIPALAGRDLVLIFIESYGSSALDQPRYGETIRAQLEAQQTSLESAGLAARSARMISPIRGGQSWLAHASVFSGQRVDNDLWYRQLLDSPQAWLTQDLALTGHHSLVLAPAIERDWPEAGQLGFDEVMAFDQLAYRGPRSGWVGIPDQYTLHRLSQRMVDRPAGQVLFAVAMLISSHAPWTPPPPLLQRWSDLDQVNPWPDWKPEPSNALIYLRQANLLRERYPQALAYSLGAAFQWAIEALPADALLVVMGDHQPAGMITGKQADASVPVHILSRDPALLRGLTEHGFQPGLLTSPSGQEAGIESLRFLLREL